VQAWVVTDGISRAGDAAWLLGLAWTAAQVGGAHGASLVIGIGTFPRALLTVFGGALADRVDPRRTMVLSNLGRLLTLAIGVVVMTETPVTIPLLTAIAVVFGAIDALYRPASGTLPRQLVREEDLGGVSGMLELAQRLANFVGAPIGGLLIATAGLRLVMLVDIVSFIGLSVVLWLVLETRFPRPLVTGLSVFQQIGEGLGYIRRTASVRTLVLALSGLNLCATPVLSVGLVLRAHGSHWSPASLGLMEATIAVAAAAASACAIAWRPARSARTGLLLLTVQATACIAVGFTPFVETFVAMAVVGVTAGLASVLLSTAFMRTVSPEYLGRTGSILGLGDDALMPVATVAFGAMAASASVAAACAVMGTTFAALVTWSATRPAFAAPDRTPAVAC
jgi:MFS family permease